MSKKEDCDHTHKTLADKIAHKMGKHDHGGTSGTSTDSIGGSSGDPADDDTHAILPDEVELEKKNAVSSSSLFSVFGKKHKHEKEEKQSASSVIAGDPNGPEQAHWASLSKFLQGKKLKDIKSLPHMIEAEGQLSCPGFGEKSNKVARVNVLKRFNSRKLPHFLDIENDKGDHVKFIFKQDDDISMDVAVMELLRRSNELWKKCGCKAQIRTYHVFANPDLTGFVEVVPGQTMLKVHADDMINDLGESTEKWDLFYRSLIATLVATAAFDITDRHHNNVMFTPDGDICLIDLSASLGNKAPLDAGLKMNPVYFPKRLRKMLKAAAIQWGKFGREPVTWTDMEQDAVGAYFAIYNCRQMQHTFDQVKFNMYTPCKYHNFLAIREHDMQKRERTRNVIVNTMDNNETVNRMVAGITKVLPMN